LIGSGCAETRGWPASHINASSSKATPPNRIFFFIFST